MEIPKHIRRKLDFKFVKHMDEVLKIALAEDPETKVTAAKKTTGATRKKSTPDKTGASGRKSTPKKGTAG